MKVSQLFGKRVESADGKKGYIIRVNCIEKHIKSFTCADGDEREFDIPVKNIVSGGNTFTYSHEEKGDGTERSISLGKPVYDCEGNSIGALTDIITEKYRMVSVVVGNKKFSAEDVICGDAVIIKSNIRFLKSDVKKNGKIIFRKGTPLSKEVVEKAQLAGEYVQTNLKTIS